MKKNVVIPSAVQICIDDVGWFNGSDQRYIGLPSRTGMTRRHCPEDYTVLNEIGKAIGMKLMCPLVLGEWDRDNILRGEVGLTYEPQTWDRASKLDLRLAEKCFEAAENSEYIEYAHHGVLHGSYAPDGSQITEMEYLRPVPGTDRLTLQSESEIAHRFDVFYKLYDTWGFKKKIRSFAFPNGIPAYITEEELEPLTDVMKSRGIEYWANARTEAKEKRIGNTEFIGGILYMEKGTKAPIPWNAYDVDPLLLPDVASEDDEKIGIIFGTHWPNYLRFNARHNPERVDDWAKYFKRQAEIFGVMISKDIAFAGNQCVYRAYGKVTESEGKITFDLSDVLARSGKYASGEFYVSLRHGLDPKSAEGGTYELYEKHENFNTYKIKHTSPIVELTV